MRYQDALLALAEKNPNIVVMTAENRSAIRDLPAKLGPRFVDVGIAEQTMIGMAAGLALRGRIPVVHALAAFLTMRAFEFIRTDVGIAGLPVKLVGAVPGFLSEANGPTHQAIEDISLMLGIPGMQVVCPADESELLDLLPEIVASPHPVYVRYPGSLRVPRPSARDSSFRAVTEGAGREMALLVYGPLVEQAMRAADVLHRRGVAARVVQFRSLRPFDDAVMLQCARECTTLVTIEDHFAHGGLSSLVADRLVQSSFSPRLIRIALEQRWFRPGLLADVLRVERFTGDQLASRILRELRDPSRTDRPETETVE